MRWERDQNGRQGQEAWLAETDHPERGLASEGPGSQLRTKSTNKGRRGRAASDCFFVQLLQEMGPSI